MSYTHLTVIERAQLELLVQQGHGVRAIGRMLQRPASCMSRELRRNACVCGYNAQEAKDAYGFRRKVSKPRGKWSPERAQEIEQELEKTFSPEQIEHSRQERGLPAIAFKTIYNWLYKGRLSRGNLQVLRQKGKRRKPLEKRGRFAIGRSFSSARRRFESAKASVTGNWTPWFPAGEKVKPASRRLSSEKRAFTKRLRCRIGRHSPWKWRLVSSLLNTRSRQSGPRLRIGARNLLVTQLWSARMAWRSTLLTLIALDGEGPTKTPMVCSGNSFRKGTILLQSLKKNLHEPCS